MRIIAWAIAFMFILGAALPTPADARAPRRVAKWGCTIRAVGLETEDLGGAIAWGGYGRIRGCDRKQWFVVRMAVVQVIPGERNRMVNLDRWVLQLGPGGVHEPTTPRVAAGTCTPEADAASYPFYFRMAVRRRGKPGVVRVATPDLVHPCPEGTGPVTYEVRPIEP